MTLNLKKWFFQLFFGGDILGESMFNMLTIRKAVTVKHAANKEAARKLAKEQAVVAGLKTDYDNHRDRMEQAYKLELD